MKVAVINKDKIAIKEALDITLNGRTGAIVRVLGCGLCGSDIVKFIHKISKDGTVLGHEIVAEITEINSKTNFNVGDEIVTSHHIPCGECVYCKNGNVSMCPHFKETNIQPGGFSEYVYLTEEHLQNVAYIKPDNLTDVEASFYEPLGCCVRAVKRAQLRGNSTALVVGLGSIGILMAQGLKSYGVNVFGFDINKERQEFVKKYGIEFNPNIKYDLIFMTSGSSKALDNAIKLADNGGKIIVFSSISTDDGYKNDDIYYKELSIIGSYSPSPNDLKLSSEFLSEKKVKTDGLSSFYKIEEIEKAINDTKQGKILKGYIKL